MFAVRARAVSAGGQNDIHTVFLLHMDGADASTTFTDKSFGGSAHTVFVLGDAQVDTAQSKFGGASLLLDGTGDFLSLDGHADFAFGTDDFTVDFWARRSVIDAQHILYDSRPTSTNGDYLTIFFSSGNKLSVFVNSTLVIEGTTNVAANTWYHVAVTRSGTSTRAFLDGVQEGTTFTDNTSYLNGADRPRIGARGTDGGTAHQGWIDELRVTNGVARWTGTFSPPTAPYIS